MSITPGYLSLSEFPFCGDATLLRTITPVRRVSLSSMRLSRGSIFPDEDPIGQHIDHGQEGGQRGVETIVGVVADFHDGGLATPANPMMIVPIAQVSDDYNAAYANIQPLFWVVRTRARSAPVHSGH